MSMSGFRGIAAAWAGIGLGLLIAGCGGGSTSTTTTKTYVLTVNSTNPASGVAISYGNNHNNVITSSTTSFTVTESAGTTVTLTAPATASGNTFSSWTGCATASTVTCTVTLNANTTVTANYTATVTPATYVLTVNSTNPSSSVVIESTSSYNGIASAVVYSGTTSFTESALDGTIYTLTAPATSGSNTFSSWTGCTSISTVTCTVTLSGNTTVTANYATPVKTTPTVTVSLASSSITTAQALAATVTVSGTPTPTGTVKLTSGSYSSAATTLTSGSATIDIPAGSLAAGSDTLTAAYTPDSSSFSIYNTATGSSSAVTVTQSSAVTVDQSSDIAAVTDQILGMNMAYWYDPSTAAIVPAFKLAGIKAMRWPGGSGSDDYHWANNTLCEIPTGGTTLTPTALWLSTSAFPDVVTELITPAGLDVALTADYGTNAACTGGGDPTEAAAWVAEAKTLNANVSHVTVGNEVYGSWEEDLHSSAHDPTTYAAAVAGTSGYYDLIKAADSSVKVGVVVEPNYAPWDEDVLSEAPYDFVEYHYYPETPGSENDTTLMHTDAQQLTTNIKTIKAEMAKWGTTVPIYVGEIGGPYSNPGKQSWSITQGLYAGQVLGEMMNDGVSRLTWWIGFGNCNGASGNDSSSVYGWQDFGAYNVFSDGPSETSCPGDGAIGTMSPTARAFQLFSNVAVTGESALTATVAGDTSDVRAYAATHRGGTALVLFNLNETTSEPVTVTLSGQTSSTGVTVITYDKALYDQTDATTPVWADPTTSTLGAQSLPLTLTLTPWSMNVVIIK